MRSQQDGREGFTLIELMIVVAIIAIIASVAIPNLISARMRANEAAAVAMMKNISAAQSQFKASAAVDTNFNGAGEYGFLCELGGVRGLRNADGSQSASFLDPRLLSIFTGAQVTLAGGATTTTAGAMTRSGYHFAVFLPQADGSFAPEHPDGGSGTGNHSPNPLQSESYWCMYAWPSSFANSGRRCFFVNQSGDIYAAKNVATGARYSGVDRAPSANAALMPGLSKMHSTIAANTTGNDGQLWIVVN